MPEVDAVIGDPPCRVVHISGVRQVHLPSPDQCVTLREAARLQAIPDSFDFGHNSAADIGDMTGGPVHVDLAARMARLLAVLFPAC